MPLQDQRDDWRRYHDINEPALETEQRIGDLERYRRKPHRFQNLE